MSKVTNYFKSPDFKEDAILAGLTGGVGVATKYARKGAEKLAHKARGDEDNSSSESTDE